MSITNSNLFHVISPDAAINSLTCAERTADIDDHDHDLIFYNLSSFSHFDTTYLSAQECGNKTHTAPLHPTDNQHTTRPRGRASNPYSSTEGRWGAIRTPMDTLARGQAWMGIWRPRGAWPTPSRERLVVAFKVRAAGGLRLGLEDWRESRHCFKVRDIQP